MRALPLVFTALCAAGLTSVMACGDEAAPAAASPAFDSGGVAPGEQPGSSGEAPPVQDGGGSGLEAGVTPPPPPPVPAAGIDVETSGTRLGLRMLSAGELQQPVAWTDRQRGQHCALGTLAGANTRTCAPLYLLPRYDLVFGQSDCAPATRFYPAATTPSFAAQVGLQGQYDPVPLLATSTGDVVQLFERGAASASQCWERFSANSACEVRSFGCDGYGNLLGAAVPLSSLPQSLAPTRTEGTPLGISQWVFGDGAKAFAGWDQGGQACAPGSAADGKIRCFPVNDADLQFADGLCQTPVGIVAADATAPLTRLANVRRDTCGAPVHELYAAVPFATLHPERSTVQLYALNAGVCRATAQIAAAQVFVATTPLPADEAPEMQTGVLENARLRAEYTQSSGFKQFRSFYDKELQVSCAFQVTGASAPYCWPTSSVALPSDGLTFYTDATCFLEVVRVYKKGTSSCEEERLLAGDGSDLYRIAPMPAQLFLKNAQGVCALATLDSSKYYARGQLIPTSALAQGLLDP